MLWAAGAVAGLLGGEVVGGAIVWLGYQSSLDIEALRFPTLVLYIPPAIAISRLTLISAIVALRNLGRIPLDSDRRPAVSPPTCAFQHLSSNIITPPPKCIRSSPLSHSP